MNNQQKALRQIIGECDSFPRHIHVDCLERNRLVTVGLGHLHAAIPHPMLHVAAPEENQARLEFRFVGDECHIRLHRLTRPVQIPCRSLLASH
jgi:hypothetical protein